jgi:SAM-dependent methyltransferase
VAEKRRSKIPNIGPTKEKTLIEAGYNTIEDLEICNFYDILRLPNFGYVTTCNLFSYLGREINYVSMFEIHDSTPEEVLIENKVIKPWAEFKKTTDVEPQPKDFKVERTTVWSFKTRGDWASHTAQYRGNWSPYVARNIIELYSKPGDTVLDPMVGGGTTAVECYLTGRNSMSSDINPGAISITRDRLNLPKDVVDGLPPTQHRTFVGDARNLDLIADASVDLVATHPPYANMIKYTPSVDGDLSQINDYALFFREFKKVIGELHRVLKPGAYCAILMGDTHNRGHYVPITTHLMLDFLNAGFILKEEIIKKEWNCESDRNLVKYAGANFLLTMHEHLFIFRKPFISEGVTYRNSSNAFFADTR